MASSVCMTECDVQDELQQEEIPAEIVAAIAAAAAVFLGRRLRIRSIETLNPARHPEGRWIHQGRALVQASHNLPRKR